MSPKGNETRSPNVWVPCIAPDCVSTAYWVLDLISKISVGTGFVRVLSEKDKYCTVKGLYL